MITGEQRGFTIIEVTLFLAISAMLLTLAFAFTNSTLRNTRFMDATKSLQSFLQQQYTRVQTNSIALNAPSGTAARCTSAGPVENDGVSSGTGTSTTCILLGSALDIASDGTHITITPVLGYAPSTDMSWTGINPQLWTAAAEIYTMGWQSTISTNLALRMADIANPALNTDTDIDRLLFIRSVQSEAISFYATHQATALTTALTTTTPSNTRNVPALLCIQSDDGGSLRGAVHIKGSGTENATNINAISSSVVSQSELFFKGIATGFEGVSCGA